MNNPEIILIQYWKEDMKRTNKTKKDKHRKLK